MNIVQYVEKRIIMKFFKKRPRYDDPSTWSGPSFEEAEAELRTMGWRPASELETCRDIEVNGSWYSGDPRLVLATHKTLERFNWNND